MCRLVRDFHHGHDTWLVVLAGSAHRDTGEAWRAGADDCVATPAPAADLCARVDKGLHAMRAQEYSDLLSEREEGADTFGDDQGPRTDAPEQRATLDAVRGPTAAPTTSSTSAPPLCGRLRAPSRDGSARKWARSAPARADEPTGAALLEAVLHQP